jgi:capsular polysaccharide biosynthesis protein
MKLAAIGLIKVKSCNALLRLLLLCISFLIYKFLILDTYHQNTYIYVSKNVRIRGYFSKSKGVREQKRLGTSDLGKKEEA